MSHDQEKIREALSQLDQLLRTLANGDFGATPYLLRMAQQELATIHRDNQADVQLLQMPDFEKSASEPPLSSAARVTKNNVCHLRGATRWKKPN